MGPDESWHYRQEERRPDGTVSGSYGLKDASGRERIFRYSSGPQRKYPVGHLSWLPPPGYQSVNSNDPFQDSPSDYEYPEPHPESRNPSMDGFPSDISFRRNPVEIQMSKLWHRPASTQNRWSSESDKRFSPGLQRLLKMPQQHIRKDLPGCGHTTSDTLCDPTQHATPSCKTPSWQNGILSEREPKTLALLLATSNKVMDLLRTLPVLGLVVLPSGMDLLKWLNSQKVDMHEDQMKVPAPVRDVYQRVTPAPVAIDYPERYPDLALLKMLTAKVTADNLSQKTTVLPSHQHYDELYFDKFPDAPPAVIQDLGMPFYDKTDDNNLGVQTSVFTEVPKENPDAHLYDVLKFGGHTADDTVSQKQDPSRSSLADIAGGVLKKVNLTTIKNDFDGLLVDAENSSDTHFKANSEQPPSHQEDLSPSSPEARLGPGFVILDSDNNDHNVTKSSSNDSSYSGNSKIFRPLYDSRGVPVDSENVPLHLHRYVQPAGVVPPFPWKFAIPAPPKVPFELPNK